MKTLLIILFSYLTVFAQNFPTPKDISVYQGSYSVISFDISGDVTLDSLTFGVKPDTEDETARVINKHNTGGGGSDVEIQTIARGSKSTVLVKLSTDDSGGLEPAIYYYDLWVDSTAIFYGSLKIVNAVTGKADGVATSYPYYTIALPFPSADTTFIIGYSTDSTWGQVTATELRAVIASVDNVDSSEVAGMIGDSLTANNWEWVDSSDVSGLINDSLASYTPSALSQDEVETIVGDSLAANSWGWVNTSDVSGLINDTADVLRGELADSGFVLPADTTDFRTFSDLKYLAEADSTDFRTFSDLKYLVEADSTDFRTFSDLKYQPLDTDLDNPDIPLAEVSDTLLLKLDKDFTDLTAGTIISTDVIPYYSIDKSDVRKTTPAELPVSADVQDALNNKVSTTAFSDTVEYFASEVLRLEQLIRGYHPVDTATTPISVTALASQHTAADTTTGVGTITLTYSDPQIADSLYKYIYISYDGATFPTNLIDSTKNEFYVHSNKIPHDTTWTYYVRVSSGDGFISNEDTARDNQVSDFVTQNYYVSTASAGDGTGIGGWTNKKQFHILTESLLLPGDTVYVDGGSSELVYDYDGVGKTSNIAIGWDNVDGTASDRIVVTRGIDAGHNGIPKIYGKEHHVFYLQFCDYLEFSYLYIDSTGVDKGGIYPADRRTAFVLQESSSNIDILHNYINYMGGYAVTFNNADNIRIMYNTIICPATDEENSTDALQGENANYIENLEIAYNDLINLNTNITEDPHRDIVQLTWTKNFSFHHNYVYVECPVDIIVQGIYLENCAEDVLIYDNVMDFSNSGGTGTMINVETWQLSDYPNYYVYNNTLIAGATTATIGLFDAAKIVVKNNLNRWVEMPGNYLFYELVTGDYSDKSQIDVDYNVYEYTGSFASQGSWATWTGTYGQDANSVNTGFTLATEPPVYPDTSDYRLEVGSDGLDDGVNLAGLGIFTDDYAGTTRDGTWDIGAFENSGGGGATYGSELISNTDFTSDITDWAGNISTAFWYDSDWNSIGESGTASIPVLLDSATGTSTVRVSIDLISNLEASKTYKLEFDYYLPTTNTTADGLRAEDYYGSTQYFTPILTTTDAWTHYNDTFVAEEVKDGLDFKLWYYNVDTWGTTNITVGDKFYIDNVSLKEVL